MSASDRRSRQLKSSQFNGKHVLYWMVIDKRAHDNWALLEAQKIAIERKVPLLVCIQFMGSYKDGFSPLEINTRFSGTTSYRLACNRNEVMLVVKDLLNQDTSE